MRLKTYTELIKLPTFDERLKYLQTTRRIGVKTFGKDRYLNQMLYQSAEWKHIHDFVVARDTANGFPLDLAHPDCLVYGKVVVHHMIPLTVEMLEKRSRYVLDPEYLITCSNETHETIHFRRRVPDYVPRRPNDTCPWKN